MTFAPDAISKYSSASPPIDMGDRIECVRELLRNRHGRKSISKTTSWSSAVKRWCLIAT